MNEITLIRDLIKSTSSRFSNNIAIEDYAEKFTFSELDRITSNICHFLRNKCGLREKSPVAICMNHSCNTIFALLAIIKAGCYYVPLSKKYPLSRANFILNDVGAELVLTDDSSLEYGIDKFVIDDIKDFSDTGLPGYIDTNLTEDDLLYTIYTSGTTGFPKGVQITNRSVVNFVMSISTIIKLQSEMKVLSITPITFDISVLEIFATLCSGGHIVIASEKESIDGFSLKTLINKKAINVIQATPSTYQMLLSAGWNPDKSQILLVGGDNFPTNLAHKLLPNCKELWNMYGPTETTVWSSANKITHLEHDFVPIGNPILNTDILVLDDKMQPVAEGQIGDLYIGGDGLAKGYLNLPQLNEQKFVTNPLKPGHKCYKTGDLARFHQQDFIEFVGRDDLQVKIRGHRIELKEIDNCLDKHESIFQAIVCAIDDDFYNKKLIAFIKLRENKEVTDKELRAYLGKSLPDYMVPSSLLIVDEFPLNDNKKIDRKKLIENKTSYQSAIDKNIIEPSTIIEKELVEIWKQYLEITHEISIEHNFFELGGHSLVAILMISFLNDKYQINLKLTDIFEKAPTIKELSIIIENKLFEQLENTEINDLLEDLDKLSDEEIDKLLTECQN